MKTKRKPRTRVVKCWVMQCRKATWGVFKQKCLAMNEMRICAEMGHNPRLSRCEIHIPLTPK